MPVVCRCGSDDVTRADRVSDERERDEQTMREPEHVVVVVVVVVCGVVVMRTRCVRAEMPAVPTHIVSALLRHREITQRTLITFSREQLKRVRFHARRSPPFRVFRSRD